MGKSGHKGGLPCQVCMINEESGFFGWFPLYGYETVVYEFYAIEWIEFYKVLWDRSEI